MTSTTESKPKSKAGRRALVVLGAVVAAVLVWFVAVPLLGNDVTVPASPGATERVDLGVGPVIGTALIAGLLGWALLAVLERFTQRALTVWTVIAVVVLIVSMPFMPGFSGTERTVLALLHLAVGAMLIVGFRRTAR